MVIVACGGGSSTNSPESTNTINTGIAQKGPFAIGSEVIITPLDSNGSPVSEAIKSNIDSNKGQFSFTTNSDDVISFYKMEASGRAFDEYSGSVSENPLSLSSITNNPNNSSINVLTHWISQRTDSLISQGESIQNALAQAQQELPNIFGINNADSLDITESSSLTDSDNAMLLLLSGALMEVSSRYNIAAQTIMDEIGNDFADDGVLSDNGDDWFLRLQALIKNNPEFYLRKYAKELRDGLGFNISVTGKLPLIIPLASRPVATLPSEIIAEPGETISLDGSASNDGGDIINFTWFRVDQQTQYDIQVSDRFIASPTITLPDEASVLAAPNQEISLLYALVVTDVDKLTDTAVIKVTVRIPPVLNNPPIADSQTLITEEDTPLAITLTANDDDGDQLNYIITTPQLTTNGLIELDTSYPI